MRIGVRYGSAVIFVHMGRKDEWHHQHLYGNFGDIRMKTLNEVIKDLESARIQVETGNGLWVDYRDNDNLKADALHYLKTIETTENLYHDAVNKLSKWEDEGWKDRHLPLTWDELKTMKGKPVWVHLFGSGLGEWNLIHAQLDNQIWLTDGNGYIYDMHEEKQGKTWQAYRNEKYE